MLDKLNRIYNKKKKEVDVYHITKVMMFKNIFIMISVSVLIAFCIESIYSNGSINWVHIPSDFFRVSVFVLTFQCEILNYAKIIKNMENKNYALDSSFRSTFTKILALIYGCFWILIFNVGIFLLINITGIKYNMVFGAHLIESLIVGAMHAISFYQFRKIVNMDEPNEWEGIEQ